MGELKVKSEFIGACTSVKGIGQIKIRQDHAPILAQAGRWELLEGEAPNVKKLVPVQNQIQDQNDQIQDQEKTPIKKKKHKK